MDAGKRTRSEGRPTPRAAETRRTKDLIRRLMMGYRGRLDEELRPRKVTTAQLRLLSEVRRHPGATGAQLARACFITPQSAQAMVALAVGRGWVVRGKDPENERLVTVRLTRAGEKLLELADAILAGLEAEVWSGVPLAELRQVNATLAHVLRNLDASNGADDSEA